MAEAKAFLSGESAAVQRTLSEQMEKASADLDFETAAALRDRIKALSYIQGAQDINPGGVSEADVFALHSEGGQSCVQVFFFRAGQNWGNHAYFPKHDKEEDSKTTSFLCVKIGDLMGRPLGCIALHNKLVGGRFTEDDEKTLNRLCDALGRAFGR